MTKITLPKFDCTEDALEFGLTATKEEREELLLRRSENRINALWCKEVKALDQAMIYACLAQFDWESLQAHDILRREG